MRIIKELKYQYNKIRDRWVFRTFWIQKKHSRKAPVSKTILIIRLDAIGDCIIWLDQAKEYRKAFPKHRIVLLHNKAWTEIADNLPWFDECIPFDRKKIGDKKYYKELITILNKYTYEIAFSPVYSRDLFTVDWIIHNVNANKKIGYEGDYTNNEIFKYNIYYRHNAEKLDVKLKTDHWYTKIVSNSLDYESELERNAHYIRKTINNDFKSKLPIIPFDIPKYNEIPLYEYSVLFLGASTEYRMWPVCNFVKVVQYLPYNTIVLCGSSDEKGLAEEFLSTYVGNKKIINLTGKTSLLNLISVISNAKFVISNETSASHIAVATRTPSVCLLGGGHYGRFQPYEHTLFNDKEKYFLPIIVTTNEKSCFKCNWKCKFASQNGRWKCINNIKEEDVIAALNRYFTEQKTHYTIPNTMG